jgi:hypothetical protein
LRKLAAGAASRRAAAGVGATGLAIATAAV